MDAVADITAVCLLMNKIAPDQVIVSPVHVEAVMCIALTAFCRFRLRPLLTF